MTVTAERCEVCHRNFPLTGTVCHPCSSGDPYHQDQDQDQDQTRRSEMQFPGPGGNHIEARRIPTRARALVVTREDDGPDLHRLEEAHHLGKLQPLPVQLGEVPASAGPVMCSIADHMRTRMGLRLAVGDDRPLPYATSQAVEAGLAADKSVASRAIRALVRAGVIEHVGQLKPLRPGLDGTKLYAPPGAARARDLGATG